MYVASGGPNKKILGVDQLSLPHPYFSPPVSGGTPTLSTVPVPGLREGLMEEGTLGMHLGL